MRHVDEVHRYAQRYHLAIGVRADWAVRVMQHQHHDGGAGKELLQRLDGGHLNKRRALHGTALAMLVGWLRHD
jgi:hypothetical protein